MGIIAYRRDLVVRGDLIHDPRLKRIHVLIFVNQDLSEAVLVIIACVLVGFQYLEPQFEEVVVVVVRTVESVAS